jgi:hypothetical protein
MAEKELEAIKTKLKQLKKKPPANLDAQFSEANDAVFSEFDCLTCANCCKTTSPMLFEKDIERLSKHLKMKPGAFIEQYLFLDTDGIYAFRQTPCPFLGGDNYCSVYEHRPKACAHQHAQNAYTACTGRKKPGYMSCNC